RRIFDAATSCIARVTCWMFLMLRTRRRSSRSEGTGQAFAVAGVFVGGFAGGVAGLGPSVDAPAAPVEGFSSVYGCDFLNSSSIARTSFSMSALQALSFAILADTFLPTESMNRYKSRSKSAPCLLGT